MPKVMQMNDDDAKRKDRGGQPSTNPMPNRKQRRNIAKQNKIFKLPHDRGWVSMNSRNNNVQTRRTTDES